MVSVANSTAPWICFDSEAEEKVCSSAAAIVQEVMDGSSSI